MPSKIFVFGSNLKGIHGAGAALFARKNKGAISGQAAGLQGESYAIPTKATPWESLPLEEIAIYVTEFMQFAKANPQLQFEITAIGCGLAGYKPKHIAPMFLGAPQNCHLPVEFTKVLEQNLKSISIS